MDVRAAAAREIRSLFGDGGANVLNEADIGDNWEAALARVPEKVFRLRKGGPDAHPLGERCLAAVRDHWGRQRDLRPAIAVTRALLRLRVARLGADHPDTLLELGALGALADRAGRHEDARTMLEEAWQALRSTVGGRDLRVAVLAEQVGLHYLRAGEPLRAEAAFEQSHRIRQERAPGTQAGVAAQLGELWLGRDKVEDALPLLQESYRLMRDRFGPLHPRVVKRARSLAQALSKLQRYHHAEPVLRDLYAHARQSGEPEQVAEASFELGVGLMRVRLEEEGFRHVEEAIRMTRELGDPHPALAGRLVTWSRLVLQRGRPDEAEGLLREAVEVEARLHGDDSPLVAWRYTELAEYLVNRGRTDEALGYLDPAVSILRSQTGDTHPRTHRAADMLAALLLQRAEAAVASRDKRTARDYKQFALNLEPVLGADHEVIRAVSRMRV